tara:strand:- start:235 stop:522 length:288 start_codon:yes stop_codon:yes gene_type:complete
MAFEKGNKLAGNRKGIPNKTTQEIRDAFQLLIENNQDKLQLWLTETAMEEPARALEIILKMSEFIVPKLSRTDVKAEVTDKSIVINLKPINGNNN